MPSSPRIARLALALLLPLAGCALAPAPSAPLAPQTTSTVAANLHGRVHGGQQPVGNSAIQLLTVGTSGDYTTAQNLLTAPVSTDANGNFSITGLYTCPANSQVYLLATGGNPTPTTTNPNLTLIAALGPCASLTITTEVVLNELTTVAAVAALAPFMHSPTALGSASYDATSLAADFTSAAALVSPYTGVAPGNGIPAGSSSPVALINTLGNILSACINSTGGTAGDGTSCGTLFALSTPPNAPANTIPADTVSALLLILNHPTLNTAALLNLAPSAPPFQPTLSAAPASYTVKLIPPPATVTRSLLTLPDNGPSSLYTLLNNAQSTIDLTLYDLIDTTFSGDLVAACNRGVTVRVILDQNDEKKANTPAYNQINAAAPNCTAIWANPKYPATHEKSFAVDNSTLAVLTANINTSDYAGTRDFGIISNDAPDIASFEATFAADFVYATYTPTPGTDLIWSPTTAQTSLIGVINNATSTLQVENEEMSAANIVTALENACKRGVNVQITMTNQTSYHANFSALEAAGCGMHVYANSSKVLYIHAKVILADFNTPGAIAYLGSINFSTASLVENRELGLYLTEPTVLQSVSTTLTNDYNGAPAY